MFSRILNSDESDDTDLTAQAFSDLELHSLSTPFGKKYSDIQNITVSHWRRAGLVLPGKYGIHSAWIFQRGNDNFSRNSHNG